MRVKHLPIRRPKSFDRPSRPGLTWMVWLVLLCLGVAPATQAQTTYTLGTGTVSTAYPTPYSNYNVYGQRSQYLIKASELTALGASIGVINAIGYNVLNVSGVSTVDNLVFKMATAPTITMTSTFQTMAMTPCYSATSYALTTGWNMHSFPTPFFWNGVDDIIIESCNSSNYTTYNMAALAQTYGTFTQSTYNYYTAPMCTTPSGSSTWYRPNLKITITPLAACAAQPVAGIIKPDTIVGCANGQYSFTVPNVTLATGLTYQWQESTDSGKVGTWANVTSGTTNPVGTYTAAPATVSKWYRMYVRCNANGLTDTTSNMAFLYIPEQQYAAMPYVQSFESWASVCNTTDKPDTFWRQGFLTGDKSWRRNDQGASGWVNNLTNGAYTPASTAGTYSARYHSYFQNQRGNMDLHVNTTGGPAGNKGISYDVINLVQTGGLDSFKLFYSIDSGATFTQIDAVGATTGWVPRLINFTGQSPKTIFRFEGKGEFGNTTDIGLDNLKVLHPCNGAVTAGTISPAGPTYTCIGNMHTMTAVGATLAGSLTYEWQESIDGINWTIAQGINGSTPQFTTAPLAVDIYYRLKVLCNNTNDSAFSAAVRYILPPPKFATIPYAQGFESWVSLCNNTDKPDSSWTQEYYMGDNSWRRNDQGTNAAWTNTTGAYTPTSKSGSYSARFHSYNATAKSGMKLHVDMSTITGVKGLSYYVNNANGNDSLNVYISTDSGLTYTLVDASSSPTNGWYPRTVNLTTNSSKTILKFEGSAVGGSGGTDIGVDDVMITGPCSGAPFAGSITPAGPIMACAGERFVLNATGTSYAGGVTFQWEDSTAVHTWLPVVTGTGGITLQYTTPMVNQTSAYRLKVTCGTQVSYTAPVKIYITLLPKYATFPYEQDFEDWGNYCNITDAPSDSSWRNLPSTGQNSWRRYDQGASAGWTSPTAGTYGPIASSGNYSARFHSYYASTVTAPKDGNLNLYIDLSQGSTNKKLIYDYINPVTSGTDSMSVWLSNDGGNSFTYLGTNNNSVTSWTNNTLSFTGNSPISLIRFSGGPDGSCCHADLGIDNMFVVEDCAGTPNAGTPYTIPANPCKTKPYFLKLDNYIPAAGQTYQWQDSSSISGGVWTNIGIANATPNLTYNAPFNAPDTVYYRCVVTCTATSLMDTSTIDTVVFNPFFLCYCDVAISTSPTGNPWIDSITVSNVLPVTNTAIFASNPGVNVATQYFQHPVTPFTTDTLAMTDTAKIRLRMSGGNNKTVGMWVDLNRNGVFESAEFKLLGTNVGTGANIILNASYYIPDTAQRGYTGMRIMVANGFTPNGGNACGGTSFSSGEVEDLVVFIEYPPCSTPPNPGTASVNKVKTCPLYPVKLQTAGYQQQVTGLSFNWQVSNDGTNWSYVPFATHDTATAYIQFPVNYFRCEVKCYGGTPSYTNYIKVTAHPDYACYCYSASTDASDSSDIGAFKFGKFVITSPGGTHLLNPKAREVYTDYIDNGPIVAWADSTYDISIFHILGKGQHADAKATVFIDYNRNGHYDIPQERVFTGYTVANNYYLTGKVKIPANILVGLTGMRVVLNENINPNVPSDEGCGEYGNGETEDYLINLKSNLPAVGITEIDGVQEFSLYPNPTSGQVNIYFKAQRSEKMNLVVTNVAGQVVKEETLDVKSGAFYKTFDLTQAAKGVYFVKLSSGSNGSIIRKVVVQ